MPSTSSEHGDLLSSFRRVIVIAAHPDDEALGCGATIRSLADSGAEVSALFLTDGVSSRLEARDRDARAEACRRASECLGIAEVRMLDLPDNQLDSVPLLEIVQLVEEVISEYEPSLAITHSSADLNIDHRIVREAAVTATRPIATQSVRMLISFEVPSATEWGFREPFRPSLFRDTTSTWSAKIEALKHYQAELRPAPHPRSLMSIEALARYRGSTISAEFAEAFEVVRLVDRNG